MRLTFKELKDEIAKIVPKSIDYKVGLEAGNIAIITNEPEKFGGGDGLVGKIAKNQTQNQDKTRPKYSKATARSKVDYRIGNTGRGRDFTIYFDACFSEVIIQCQNPRRGSRSKRRQCQ